MLWHGRDLKTIDPSIRFISELVQGWMSWGDQYPCFSVPTSPLKEREAWIRFILCCLIVSRQSLAWPFKWTHAAWCLVTDVDEIVFLSLYIWQDACLFSSLGSPHCNRRGIRPGPENQRYDSHFHTELRTVTVLWYSVHINTERAEGSLLCLCSQCNSFCFQFLKSFVDSRPIKIKHKKEMLPFMYRHLKGQKVQRSFFAKQK